MTEHPWRGSAPSRSAIGGLTPWITPFACSILFALATESLVRPLRGHEDNECKKKYYDDEEIHAKPPGK